MATRKREARVTAQAKILTDTIERLSLARELSTITSVVAQAARALVGADGATFVLRDGGLCYYADEDAISPLWKGKRFPLEACISGWSMLNRKVVMIEDIYGDARIPHDAYRPTFVKSLCMVPIRSECPIGAIGNYWQSGRIPGPEEIKLLQILANSSAIAIENLELRKSAGEVTAPHLDIETTIHSIAHDLRSPIATICGLAEVLDDQWGESLNATAKQFVDGIQKTGYHALQRIERMLALHRTVQRELKCERVDLSNLALELMGQLRAQGDADHVDFSVEPGLDAHADVFLIRVALENLLANAVKYSGKKPRPVIRFGRDEGDFFVRDNGVGFDPELAPRLFQPFVRLHSDAEFQGNGLGLVSVARIMELHGGSIRAEGRIGEGAVFRFNLPIVGESA